MKVHFYLDGYNLLFRTAWKADYHNLQQARQQLIEEINRHAARLKLTITIVFDAAFAEEVSQGHYQNIEIIFTFRDVSADQYLIDFFSSVQKPRDYTLVTSDKPLARQAKYLGVATIDATVWINQLRRKESKKSVVQKEAPRRTHVSACKKIVSNCSTLPPLGDIAAWEAIFTSRLT